MVDEEEVVCDLTRKDWKYKGILFAEMDSSDPELVKSVGEMPPDYVAGLMAVVYVDENGIWNAQARIKFPSGNKQVWRVEYKNREDRQVNETLILQDFYKLPLKNKGWYLNETEDQAGMFKILQDTNMIESIRILHKGEDDEGV